jgi:nucleoside-triphosphatase
MPTTALLITGPPGSGKTTAFRRIIESLRDVTPCGFYTGEVRERGVRIGFDLVSLSGRRQVLARTGMAGPRVGKYGVDVAGLEAFLGDPEVLPEGAGVVVVDEIGKMECLSPHFRSYVVHILESGVPCIATIALRGDAFIESLKNRPDVVIRTLTRENRERLLPELIRESRRLAGAGNIRKRS